MPIDVPDRILALSFTEMCVRIIELEGKLGRYRDEIRRLFDLLDDIDTAEDMFKPDDSPYFQYVHRKQRERANGITTTDGYTLTIDGEAAK